MKHQENLNIHRNIYFHYGGRNIPHSKGSAKGVEERKIQKVGVIVVTVAMLLCFIPIIVEIVPNVSSATTWYVDDVPGGSPPEDFTSIQDAVNASQPGDTVFVWSGVYKENVVINKSINLTGISKNNTTINGIGSYPCINVQNTTKVFINEFNLTNGSYGVVLENASNNIVSNNFIVFNSMGGIHIINSSSHNILSTNIINNNYGVGIEIYLATNNSIVNSVVSSNDGIGIRVGDYSNIISILNSTISFNLGTGIHISGISTKSNNIENSNISNNKRTGIELFALNNTVKDSKVTSNGWGEFGWFGIHVGISDKDNKIINTTLLFNRVYGINFENGAESIIINSTIRYNTDYDLNLKGSSIASLLNTSFNKTDVHLDSTSIMTVEWYLHVNVWDYIGNPVPNAYIKIKDNNNGTYNKTQITDENGSVRWIEVMEYIHQGTEKTYYTPHKLIAWNETLVGYIFPDMIINKSKVVNIFLYNGTLNELEPGWNLISLPRIQFNPDLQTILQSINGQYDAVQWYNVTDGNDPWKHYHSSKPSNLNDLKEINHTMGFWIHIINPDGVILLIFGNMLTNTQNISLYPGWNHVGFPSMTNKTRDVALNNLIFDSEIDAIWTFNSTSGKWMELDIFDYFEVSQGYWIHSKVTKVWNVPL